MANGDDEINLVVVLAILLVVLISKQLYDLYKKFTKNHHEVYFVMSDTNCCNAHENPGATNQCKKYCLGKLVSKIRNRINSSKSSICIAMYNFSNHMFADYVLSAHRRGVKIRLLVDKSACESPENRTQAKRLKNAGIPVRVSGANEKLMHNKFCLIDGTNARGVLITGSLNWTYGGLSKNCENVAFINNHRVKHLYREAFDHMWNKASQYTPSN